MRGTGTEDLPDVKTATDAELQEELRRCHEAQKLGFSWGWSLYRVGIQNEVDRRRAKANKGKSFLLPLSIR